jgi:hypothetical protein
MRANLVVELPDELDAVDHRLYIGFGSVVELPEVDGRRIKRIGTPEADDAGGVVGVGLENDPGQDISFSARNAQ